MEMDAWKFGMVLTSRPYSVGRRRFLLSSGAASLSLVTGPNCDLSLAPFQQTPFSLPHTLNAVLPDK